MLSLSCASLVVNQSGTCSINFGQKGCVAPRCLWWEKNDLSGVTSSPTLAKLHINKRQCTLSCPVAHNPGSMEDQNTHNRRVVTLSHLQHCILLCFSVRKAATCPAKSRAGRNGVIVPDHNCKAVPALLRTQTGVKASVNHCEGESQRACSGVGWRQENSWPTKGSSGKKEQMKTSLHRKCPCPTKSATLPVLKSCLKEKAPLALLLKKQQQPLISGKGGGEWFTFSWFLGLLQHCLINWEQDLCAIKCSGEVADAKALHLGFESLSNVMRISVYSHLGKESPPENQKWLLLFGRRTGECNFT